MTTPTISQPVYPGSTGHGAAWKEVVVLAVDREQQIAVCRDQLGQNMRVRCDIMRAKGNLPAVNERWLVDRQYNSWTFAAIMNGGTNGVIIPPDSVTGLPETLQDHVDLISNVDNQAQVRDTALGGRATTLENNTLSQLVAKGDLIAATNPATGLRLAVGAVNTVLTPDAATATGLAYKAPLALVTPLTGATAAGRYVGNTVSGAPTTGTYLKGDWVTDQAGYDWACTVAGTPGTWVTRNVDLTRVSTLEGDSATHGSAISDLRGSGKHIWYTTSGPQLNASGGDVILTTWSTYYSDGIAQLGAGNGLFQFIQPGKWSINFYMDSSAGTPGVMKCWLVPGNPNPWGASANIWIMDRSWRGSGFSGAGDITQHLTWTGRVAAGDANQAFAVHVAWLGSTAVNATLNYRMIMEYLGSA